MNSYLEGAVVEFKRYGKHGGFIDSPSGTATFLEFVTLTGLAGVSYVAAVVMLDDGNVITRNVDQISFLVEDE